MRKRIRDSIKRLFPKSRKSIASRSALRTRGLRYECLEQRQLLSITAPHIAWLDASVAVVSRADAFSLTAHNVQPSDGHTISNVYFYWDKNSDGVVNTGTDVLLGTGTKNALNDWVLSNYSSTSLGHGTRTFLAQAVENSTNPCNQAIANVSVTQDALTAALVANKRIDLTLPGYHSSGVDIEESLNGTTFTQIGNNEFATGTQLVYFVWRPLIAFGRPSLRSVCDKPSSLAC
jgi:hypothetical protein